MAKELLSQVYLFKGLSTEEQKALSGIVATDKCRAGQTTFTQGDKATALYIVKYGSIQIKHTTQSGEEIVVATLGTGSHFGEMAFLDGKTRTTTALALEDSELLRIDYNKLNGLFEKQPKLGSQFYRAMATFLAGRLENTTRDLSFAREKNLKAA